jgi:hypothetical protein
MRNDLLSVIKLFSAFCDHELRKTVMALFASMLTVSRKTGLTKLKILNFSCFYNCENSLFIRINVKAPVF